MLRFVVVVVIVFLFIFVVLVRVGCPVVFDTSYPLSNTISFPFWYNVTSVLIVVVASVIVAVVFLSPFVFLSLDMQVCESP